MKRKAIRVRRLADEAKADIDLVLVTLWDLGATEIEAPTDLIPSRFVDSARRELGVATHRDLRRSTYWAELLGESGTELQKRLEEAGFGVKSRPGRIPQGAIKYLKATARSMDIDPMTGAIRHSDPVPARVRPTSTPSDVSSFSHLGRARYLRHLTAQEIAAIHMELVADFANTDDPIDPPGVRDENLLESAAFRPQIGLGGVRKYPTVETAGAAMLYSLVHNHAFHNGNKRTALVATLVFLDENETMLECGGSDLFKFVLSIAQHRIPKDGRSAGPDRETYAIAEQLCRWSRLVSKEERVMPFRKLRQILTAYRCEIAVAGSKANISRKTRKNVLGFARKRSRHIQIHYYDEGREVGPETIKKVRKALRLDHEHGIDSSDFYSKKPLRADEFIVKYRSLLGRLGRL